MKILVATALAAALVIPRTALADEDEPAPRSPTTALELSLGGVLIPAALLAVGAELSTARVDRSDIGGPIAVVGLAGLLIAPSLGEIYAGNTWSRGATTRVAGLALTTVGGLIFASNLNRADASASATGAVGGAVVVAGLGAVVAGIAFDVVDAPQAARDANHDLQLTPTVVSTGTSHGMGLALTGSF
jgi:hypothetical protein